jgi:hypothetical protein
MPASTIRLGDRSPSLRPKVEAQRAPLPHRSPESRDGFEASVPSCFQGGGRSRVPIEVASTVEQPAQVASRAHPRVDTPRLLNGRLRPSQEPTGAHPRAAARSMAERRRRDTCGSTSSIAPTRRNVASCLRETP